MKKIVIVGSWDNNIYLYSISSGRAISAIAAHDDAISSLCLRKNKLITGSWDATLKVWEYKNSCIKDVPLIEFVDNPSEIRCVDVDPDGTIAVTGGADGCVVFWNLKTQVQIRSMAVHSDTVNKIKFTPDGSRVISCSTDGSFKVIEVASGAEPYSFDVGAKITCFETDGENLLLGMEDGTLRLWDLKSGIEIKQFKGNEPIDSLIVSERGNTVVVGCNGTIRVYSRISKD